LQSNPETPNIANLHNIGKKGLDRTNKKIIEIIPKDFPAEHKRALKSTSQVIARSEATWQSVRNYR